MASVKYHGEYPEAGSIQQYGYTFEPNKSVSVTDDYHLQKFAGNRFFEVSGKSDKEQVEQGQEDAEQAETATLKAYLDEHHVPYRANASLKALRELKADREKALEEAQA